MFKINENYLDAEGIAEVLQDAAIFETSPVLFCVSWHGHSDDGAEYEFRFGHPSNGRDAACGSIPPAADFEACRRAIDRAVASVVRYHRH